MLKFECIPVTRYQQNCSILWCDRSAKAAVIDPGGDLWMIENFLEVAELQLDIILVTHAHFDHAGGAAELASLTGAEIAGPHRDDAHLASGIADHARQYGVAARNYTPDRWLADGDRIMLGEHSIDVLHCPGHTRGHVAYFHEAGRQAFVGDILFRDTIGAWGHRDGDLADLLTSIRSKLFPLGDDVRFVPGHGPMSTFGREREHNPVVGERALAEWKRGLAVPHSTDSLPADGKQESV